GVDATRYFVLHEMPYENDGVITWDLLIERINSDLANTLGNLVKRTIAMTNKYFGGIVEDRGAAEPVDEDLKKVVTGAYEKVEKKMEELRVADALTEIFTAFKRLNKYIDETEPWVLAKDPEKQDRLATVLYNLTEGIMIGISLAAPFLPNTAAQVAKELNTELRDFDTLGTFGLYPNGNKVTEEPSILFARLDHDAVMKQVEVIQEKQRSLAAAEAAAQEQPAAAKEPAAEKEQAPEEEAVPEITYDDFAKCAFRVGEIVSAELVENSKKLLKFQVKIGSETRQILSGIRSTYDDPEKMIGMKVMVLVNLKPRKMAGMLSEGMLLCAENAEGKLGLMTPDFADEMEAGSLIS
ncbi:MAG: methionine--tRNA ligase subunit beta, partial [Lachnospiraceae bacterium]|nr:methionine--tRNA ligase subunit beta [Lachnospiraceae bacterium]